LHFDRLSGQRIIEGKKSFVLNLRPEIMESNPRRPILGVTVVNAMKQTPSEEMINIWADLYLGDSTNGEFVHYKVS
jgi:hypothetical protein